MLDRMTGELEDVAMDRQTKNFALRPVAGALIQQGNGKRLRGSLAQQLAVRSEEHTSELQSLMRISYDVFCLKKKTTDKIMRNKNIEYKNTKTNKQQYNNLQLV